jgi:hypothetical protein
MIVLYEVHLLLNLASMVYLFATLSRRERDPQVRWAMRVLAITSIGVGSRPVYTLTTIVSQDHAWPWDTAVVLDLNMIWYLLGFIGITFLGVVGLVQQRTFQRRLHLLHPLQKALAEAGMRRTSGSGEQSDMTLQQALVARYAQIEDGLWLLRDHGHYADLEQARQYVRHRRVLGRKRREAIARAASIALTLERLGGGILATPNKDGSASSSTPEPHTEGGAVATALKVNAALRTAGAHALKKLRSILPFLPAAGPRSHNHINQDIAQMARIAVAFDRHPLIPEFVKSHVDRAGQSSPLT